MTPLDKELALLRRIGTHGADLAARQLIVDAERPLPDVIPPPPEWVEFQWPGSGEVNLSGYWQEVDRKGKIDWNGPYL